MAEGNIPINISWYKLAIDVQNIRNILKTPGVVGEELIKTRTTYIDLLQLLENNEDVKKIDFFLRELMCLKNDKDLISICTQLDDQTRANAIAYFYETRDGQKYINKLI